VGDASRSRRLTSASYVEAALLPTSSSSAARKGTCIARSTLRCESLPGRSGRALVSAAFPTISAVRKLFAAARFTRSRRRDSVRVLSPCSRRALGRRNGEMLGLLTRKLMAEAPAPRFASKVINVRENPALVHDLSAHHAWEYRSACQRPALCEKTIATGGTSAHEHRGTPANSLSASIAATAASGAVNRFRKQIQGRLQLFGFVPSAAKLPPTLFDALAFPPHHRILSAHRCRGNIHFDHVAMLSCFSGAPSVTPSTSTSPRVQRHVLAHAADEKVCTLNIASPTLLR